MCPSSCCSFRRRNRVLAAELRYADTGASARGHFRAGSSIFEIDRFYDFNILLLFDLNLAALCAADLTCAAATAALAADAAPATLPPTRPARPPCPPTREGSSPSHWSVHRWATFPSKVKRPQLRALLPALALASRLQPPPADPPPARPPPRRLCRLSPARHRPRLSPSAASRRPPRQLARRPVVSPVACPPSARRYLARSRPTFYLLVIQPATPLASSPSRRLAATPPARARLSTSS